MAVQWASLPIDEETYKQYKWPEEAMPQRSTAILTKATCKPGPVQNLPCLIHQRFGKSVTTKTLEKGKWLLSSNEDVDFTKGINSKGSFYLGENFKEFKVTPTQPVVQGTVKGFATDNTPLLSDITPRPTEVNRLRNKHGKPSQTLRLSFSRLVLPKSVTISGVTHFLSPYRANITRCTHCQKYGHTHNTCKARHPVCSRCTVKGHQAGPSKCKREPRCLYCSHGHGHASS